MYPLTTEKRSRKSKEMFFFSTLAWTLIIIMLYYNVFILIPSFLLFIPLLHKEMDTFSLGKPYVSSEDVLYDRNC